MLKITQRLQKRNVFSSVIDKLNYKSLNSINFQKALTIHKKTYMFFSWQKHIVSKTTADDIWRQVNDGNRQYVQYIHRKEFSKKYLFKYDKEYRTEKQRTKKVYERWKNKIDNEYKNLEKVNIFMVVFVRK